METDLSFSDDAMQSIQTSLTFKKPMILYLRDSNTVESESWINKILFDNDELSTSCRKNIQDSFIRLQIVKDSNDFHNLVSVMPGFQNAITPCIFFIFSAQIIDVIPNNTADLKSVESKINTILNNMQQKSNVDINNNANQTPQVSRNSMQNSSTPEHKQQEKQTNSGNSRNLPMSNVNEIINKKSLKEESAELAAQKYKEKLMKQQQQAKQDRERILHLLELDRKEQKKKDEEKLKAQKFDLETDQHINENINNPKIQNSETYTIQLKLLDGKTIRHQFKNSDSLATIREYILEEYPDYNNFPFYFFKNIDRITFGDADETKSLLVLNLNMSTLIIKPLERDENLNITSSQNQNEYTFNWLKSKMYSYLFPNEISSSPHNLNQQNSQSSSDINTQHGDNNNNNNNNTNNNNNNFNDHSINPDESDTDSVYHTPLLSTTAPRIRPNVSSFNLYGSQGLISDPSINTAPNHENIETERTSNNIVGTNQAVPIPDSVYNVRNDEVDVNNGNSISLQFPDDDK